MSTSSLKSSYFSIIILLFLFIYAPRVVLYFPINLSIIVFLFFIIFNFQIFLISFRYQPGLIFFWFFLAIYNFLIGNIYGHEFIFFSKICLSVISYVLFGSMVYLVYVKNKSFNIHKSFLFFLNLLLSVIILNSFIILVEFFIPSFKTSLESILYNDYNNQSIIQYALHPYVLRGFASAAGASQSLFSSIGILIVTYFYYIGKINVPKSLLLNVLIFIPQIFIGRTGLVFSIIFFLVNILVIVFNFLKSDFKRKFYFIFIISSFIIAAVFITSYINFDSEVLLWSFDWLDLDKGFSGNSSTKEVTENYLFLPDNIFHFIFGIGYFEGKSDYYNRSDVGYVKTIFSCGILLASIIYLTVFLKLFSFSKLISNSNYFFYLLIFALILSEFKEPFIYQNFTGRALFVMFGYLNAAHHSLILRSKSF